MATDFSSRASMDNHWNKHGPEGGKPRVERKQNALEEGQRKTAGPEATAFYAKLNKSVVPEDTHKNYDFVNDGNGVFREAVSIDETLDYGEGRIGRVKSKLGDSHTTWITMVFHLPYSLCEEIPNYYPRLDDDGNQKYNTDGTPAMRSRWVIAEGMEDEAKRYFDEVVKFYCSNVLPGGFDAFHGGSVNLDESRPHLQGIADAFEEDPRSKDPDRDLKNGFSLAMGSHRKSKKIPKVDKTGEPVVDDQGNPVMVREGAREKSERFHRELKAHMLAAGFDIEAERDEARHNRRVDLPDYQDIQDREAIADQREDQADEATAEAEAIRYEVEGREEDALLDQAEAAETSQWLTDAWVESEEPALRERAEEEGYEVGETEGKAEALRRYRAAKKKGWQEGRDQAKEYYAETLEKGREFRDKKKAELDGAKARIAAAEDKAAAKAQQRWDQETKPKLVEQFNDEANNTWVPKLRAQAKVDGRADAKAEAERMVQDRLDAAEADRTAAAKDREIAAQVRAAAQTARENALAGVEAEAETIRSTAERDATAIRQAAVDEVDGVVDEAKAVIDGRLDNVMPDADAVEREVMDSASGAYVRAAVTLGHHDDVMAEVTKTYQERHGAWAPMHRQKSMAAFTSETYGSSHAKLTRSLEDQADQAAAELAKQKEDEGSKGD
ncbi:hypothetical protein [Corynebacterium glyciniphilum]|uniref:hypothetical protein n=1 Tax=Corynebacterium glyciniphilum TaxID=1404244 RepID=UPI0026564C67|nr:hypothetical protein [Corynebacterium glyciniphilum]MDN6706785.1 hypothetical protein [Corynebacterium glyciniphilum]